MTKSVATSKTLQNAKLFINGEYVDAHTNETFDSINPATHEKLAAVATADALDTKRAIDRAHRTSTSGVGSQMPLEDRSTILCRMSDLILENLDELGRID